METGLHGEAYTLNLSLISLTFPLSPVSPSLSLTQNFSSCKISYTHRRLERTVSIQRRLRASLAIKVGMGEHQGHTVTALHQLNYLGKVVTRSGMLR